MLSSNDVETVKATRKCRNIIGLVNPDELTEDLLICRSTTLKVSERAIKSFPDPGSGLLQVKVR